MGGISTQEEIVARLDELDKEEININKQLRELQIELNGNLQFSGNNQMSNSKLQHSNMGNSKVQSRRN